MENILDILFPKVCSICSKKGSYLCPKCKKLFKRNLPECYICRELSSHYKTHEKCKKKVGSSCLNSVFVAWEYNSLSSDLLKKFKYQYAYDISDVLSEFFVESITHSMYSELLKDTLLINVPIPTSRLKERGFNQTSSIVENIAENFDLCFSENLLRRKNTYEHQSLKDKGERRNISKNDFTVKPHLDVTTFKSITIVDDVLTTGITLESICEKLRETFDRELVIHGICMFRGRPYYLTTDDLVCNKVAV